LKLIILLPGLVKDGIIDEHDGVVQVEQHISFHFNRLHTSAYVISIACIRQHTSFQSPAYVSIRQVEQHISFHFNRLHTSAYVSIRQQASAYVEQYICFHFNSLHTIRSNTIKNTIRNNQTNSNNNRSASIFDRLTSPPQTHPHPHPHPHHRTFVLYTFQQTRDRFKIDGLTPPPKRVCVSLEEAEYVCVCA
jgi:hypothetical protein